MRYLTVVGVLAIAACAADSSPASTTTAAGATTTTTGAAGVVFPPAPDVPAGQPDDELLHAIDDLLDGVFTTEWDVSRVDAVVAAGDPRPAWLIADLLRFYQTGSATETLTSAFVELTGAELDPGEVEFVWATNNLIAWDLPAWDGYPEAKRKVFAGLEPVWEPFFDEDVRIDWRLVTWGGVAADGRPLDDNGPCNCIPALDHPVTTDASEGDWYEDDRIVFGLVVGEEAIALPKHQMEVHEMLNLTLGGRESGVPYCTLCGSAQAYLVDDVAGVDRVVLRTSGLLSRSNKLMYDLTTGSAIDTFTGEALSGPLARDGVVLEQVSVVASTWGDWKTAHPGTAILAEDSGIGRTYADDPLGGRDDNGPIFPVGDVDPRLSVQERVVGVVTADGTPIAFPVMATRAALADGEIEYQGLTVRMDDSIRIYDPDGNELTSHESYWFAWSQFHERSLLWSPVGG